MKFCVDCKKLYDGADTICIQCNKKYKEVTDINEPVQLCVVGGMERNMICGALKDADIPFIEQQYGPQGVANEIVTGYDAKLLNIAILVPYSAMPKAYEISVSLELCDETLLPIIEKVQADIEKYKEQLENDAKDTMSKAKHTTVKVISTIAFIVLMALVIFGTDYVMELIKNLFGG